MHIAPLAGSGELMPAHAWPPRKEHCQAGRHGLREPTERSVLTSRRTHRAPRAPPASRPSRCYGDHPPRPRRRGVVFSRDVGGRLGRKEARV